MAYTLIPGGVTTPAGFTAAGTHCGVRKNNEKKDLAMIYCEKPCGACAVYTQNLVKGAPILVTQRNIRQGRAQAVICNSGNANTCNEDGVQKANRMCELTAKALKIDTRDVIVASTGVIGQTLPIDPIAEGIPVLAASLSKEGGADAAEAIMTTDTVRKELAVEFSIGSATCRIGGMAKGSGMIHPNMATMLCFLTTDTDIHPELLDKALHEAVGQSFNMVSIDGDTSTNDMVSIMASGLAKNPKITDFGDGYQIFLCALKALCTALCKQVAKDGEGATKLLECRVTGAKSLPAAKTAAKSVICSSLVKAAMFGADANWGRVLCALGYAGTPIDVTGVGVAFESRAGRIQVCENGAGMDFDEEKAKQILLEDEILIDVTLKDGEAEATAYGCDLTYEYVKINGDYRT